MWIPSLAVHAYHTTISQANEPYFPVLIVILLTSCQGIFNALAYVWEYHPFRKWVNESLLNRPYSETNEWSTFATGIYRRHKDPETSEHMVERLVASSNGDSASASVQGSSITSGKSSKYDHLVQDERSVRFGPDSHHILSCSMYDDDDENDNNSVDVTLEETPAKIRKSVYKFIKGMFRRKSADNIYDEITDSDDENEIKSSDADILERNTSFNSNSDFFTTRRREKEREREARGRIRTQGPLGRGVNSRSPSPSQRRRGSRSHSPSAPKRRSSRSPSPSSRQGTARRCRSRSPSPSLT